MEASLGTDTWRMILNLNKIQCPLIQNTIFTQDWIFLLTRTMNSTENMYNAKRTKDVELMFISVWLDPAVRMRPWRAGKTGMNVGYIPQ